MATDYRVVGHAPDRKPSSAEFWHRPKRMNLVADLLFVLVAVAVGYYSVSWLFAHPWLALHEVIVQGKLEHTTRAQIESAVRLSTQSSNFLLTDVDAVREAFERLPWVRQANVRRRWPGTLEIRLEEQHPVAYWNDLGSDDTRLVNDRGELFSAASSADLPALSGPPGSAPEMWQRYTRFNTLLTPLGRHIYRLSLSDRQAWQVELDNGMMLILGREQDKMPVEARLTRFVQAWPQVASRFTLPVATADLRYQGGFALTAQVAPPKTVKEGNPS